MRSVVRIAAAAALWLSTAAVASAHHLWLEVDGQGAKIYFGEFGENLREASPGALDKLQPQAKAVSASGERPSRSRRRPTALRSRASSRRPTASSPRMAAIPRSNVTATA